MAHRAPQLRSVSMALATAIVGAFLCGCGPAKAESARIRVLMLGDSITQGIVSDDGTPYAELVADGLSDSHEVVNIGCGGATSADWTLSRPTTICGRDLVQPGLFEALAIPSLPADFVTILLGTNDAFGFFEPAPIEPPEYSANIDEIISELFAYGAQTVLLMTPPAVCSRFRNASRRLSAYQPELASICTSHADVLCGLDLLTQLNDSHFDGCNVHPNGSGHELIAADLIDRLLTHTPVRVELHVYQRSVPNASYPKSQILLVTLRSRPDFDAVAEVDSTTLRFGAGGTEDSLAWLPGNQGPACRPIDSDGDGRDDLVCAFEHPKTGLDSSSLEAFVVGRLHDGTALDGREQWEAGESFHESPPGLFPSLYSLGEKLPHDRPRRGGPPADRSDLER